MSYWLFCIIPFLLPFAAWRFTWLVLMTVVVVIAWLAVSAWLGGFESLQGTDLVWLLTGVPFAAYVVGAVILSLILVARLPFRD